MNAHRSDGDFDCVHARLAIQAELDEPQATPVEIALATHLTTCPNCCGYRDDLLAVRAAIRGLPAHPLPDDVLEDVWDQTVRACERRDSGRGWVVGWRPAAAAAVLAIAVLSSQLIQRPVAGVADVDGAMADVRLVLGLTGDALHRARSITVNRIVASTFSPAIRGIARTVPSITRTSEKE